MGKRLNSIQAFFANENHRSGSGARRLYSSSFRRDSSNQNQTKAPGGNKNSAENALNLCNYFENLSQDTFHRKHLDKILRYSGVIHFIPRTHQFDTSQTHPLTCEPDFQRDEEFNSAPHHVAFRASLQVEALQICHIVSGRIAETFKNKFTIL